MVTNRDRKSFGSRQENSNCCSDDWQRWHFWSAFRHLETHFAESIRMSKSSWMMDPTRSREMPSCSAINLAEIRWSYKISSWIWSIICGVVTVLGLPGRGASQVEKPPRLKRTTEFWQWHTMMRVPLIFLLEWREFPPAPCLAGKKITTARVSMFKLRASLGMLPFSLCNKKRLAFRHMNRPIFPTTPSIPSYDIGK